MSPTLLVVIALASIALGGKIVYFESGLDWLVRLEKKPELPSCHDTEAVIRGLGDFLRLQHLWRECVRQVDEVGSDEPGISVDLRLIIMRDDQVRRELCRERIASTWNGPECIADVAPNGTILGPRDIIHEALKHWMSSLRSHIDTSVDDCAVFSTFEMKMGWSEWTSRFTGARCDGILQIDRNCHWYGCYGTCKQCLNTTVKSSVILE